MRNRLLTSATLVSIILATACGGVNSNDDDDEVDAGDQQEVDAGELIDAAPQVAEAPADNDSLVAPAEEHFLSITGERNFTYTDEVSHPGGDTLDFIGFNFPPNSNPNQVVRITLDCTITGQPDAQGGLRIFQGGEAILGGVLCNEGEQTLTVNNTMEQVVEIGFTVVAEPSHIDYTLTVVGFQ